MKQNNFAYIDGANLHEGVRNLGWELDYKKFRVWLKDNYSITHAYIFIGLVPSNKDLYTYLQNAGFILIFKEITYDGDGKIKGNCDADLVLNVVSDFYEKRFDKTVVVSSDGDYASTVNFLKNKNVFSAIVSTSDKCSFLLRKLNIKIIYINDIKNRVSK
jgi:uncharacterized LabA/DUF88 family protein